MLPTTARFVGVGLVSLLAAATARADVPVSVGTEGQLQRASQNQDSIRNATGASFGSPISDDRRLFKLRWRLPWLLGSPNALGPTPFAGGYTSTGFIAPGGLSLAGEPMEGLSSLVPQVAFGEPRKALHVQAGALSTSLGHGTLVDRYTNAPDGLPRSAGLHLEGNLAGIGASATVGNLLDPLSFGAVRITGRPILWFVAPDATFQPNELDLDPRTETAGIWVTGLTLAADAQAPSAQGPVPVWSVGWDNEAAVLDNQLVKVIGYLDANGTGVGARTLGGGLHPGVTLMADLLGVRFDATVDGHVGTDGYLARGFDRLYMLERIRVLGVDKAKADLELPASWGWRSRLQAGVLRAGSVFAELSENRAFDPSRGAGQGQMTVGANAWIAIFSASVSATQTGIDNMLWPDEVGGPGFMLMGEGRVGIAWNFLFLVGRAWRVHHPAGQNVGEFVVDHGMTVGLEANFDVL